MNEISISPLTTGEEANPYLELTYKTYWPALTERAPGDGLFVLGAANPNPAGLIVARREPEEGQAMLLSVGVLEEQRRKGIATQLLQEMEAVLQENGFHKVTAVFPGGKPSTPAVEALLGRAGWSTPEARMYLYQASAAAAEHFRQNAPWMRDRTVPAGYETFAWGELTEAEWEQLRKDGQEGIFPTSLSPFQEEERIDPVLSRGLRYQGMVVGWMIVHQLGPGLVRFSFLFMRPELRCRSLGFVLMTESFHEHLARIASGSGELTTWGTSADNPLAGFVERRMKPYLPGLAVTMTYGAFKELQSPSEGMRDEG